LVLIVWLACACRLLLMSMPNGSGELASRSRIDRHYYSVPHQLARREVDVRSTAAVVEVLHAGSASPRSQFTPPG